MERTLSAFARSAAPLEERRAVVRALAREVAALAIRGKAHGALRPDRVHVLSGGAVLLAPPAPGDGPLEAAGFAAPEVARGARPDARSDAFSLGALAYLALAGEAPFEAEEPLERVRRALFEEAAPLRARAPGIGDELEGAVAALLEKRRRARGNAAALVRACAAGSGAGESAGVVPAWQPPSSTSTSIPAPAAAPASALTSTSTSTPTANPTSTPTANPTAALLRACSRISRVPALASLSPLRRAALAAVPLLALAVALSPAEREVRLEEEIAALVEGGDLAGARARLELAAKDRPGDPVVEKLRGDVACARGLAGECVRRYRVALAARPSLREDPVLRRNARRLVARDEPCATRKAAAQLLGELRDPEALPVLEAARRAGGLLSFLCTGDSIDRAITATRAELRRGR